MLSIRGGLASGLSWLLLGACGGTVVTSGDRQHDPNSGSGGATSGTLVPGGATGKTGGGAVGPIGPIGSGGTVSTPPGTGLIGAGGKPSAGGSFAAGGATPAIPICGGMTQRDPGGLRTVNDFCCKTSLGPAGTCRAPITIPEGTSMKAALGHETCDKTLVCAPDTAAVETCGNGAGVMGRCVPKCLVGGLTMPMLQENCVSGEDVCAPCFDPVDGTPTDVCPPGPASVPPPPPVLYRPCGSLDAGVPGGVCVPLSVIGASGGVFAGTLQQDDCPLATDRCVPRAKAKDPAACFQRCTTTLSGLGKQYASGACVPSFVVRDTNPTALAILNRDTCADTNALCAPCLDPLSAPVAGAPTGYCQ